MTEYAFLSFRNASTNTNLGVCIVEASNISAAILISWEKNINPGGEVQCIILSQEDFEKEGLEKDRLYTREELLKLKYTFTVIK